MKYNFYVKKDASIYNTSESVNAGHDPILEIAKITNLDGTKDLARSIVYFDWVKDHNLLTGSFSSYSSSYSASLFSATLKLFAAQPENIKYSYTLEIAPMKEAWQGGIGKLDHQPQTEEGVSWAFSDASGSSNWSTAASGGYHHTSYSTQAFEFESSDIKLDMKAQIGYLEGGVTNHGHLLRFSSSLEADTLDYGTLRFFSTETNTIYAPYLQMAWDDSSYNTGSLLAADADEILVYIKNNKYEYQEDEIARFELRARDIYPTQTYGTSSATLESKYLPTSSFYSIKDAETEEDVIEFDEDYTKVSCNANGNYFNFPMQSLTPERLYKLIVKVKDRKYSGQVEYFDSNHIFKVVR